MNKKDIINTISDKYAPLNDACKSEFTNNSKILTFKKGFSFLYLRLIDNVFHIFQRCK